VRPWLCVLAAAAALCGPAAGAAGAAVRAPAGFMGVLAGAPVGDRGWWGTEAELRAMRAAGVESLRFAFYWSHAQRTRDRPIDWSATDRIVASASRAGLRLLPVVLGTPAWARVNPALAGSRPADPRHYAAFLTELVRRYGPSGSYWPPRPGVPRRPIRQWQVWNEPDHRVFWHEQPYYSDYVRLLAAAARAVRAADPGAEVVLAGLVGRSWDQLAVLYRRGARAHFDVAAVHPFTRLLGDVSRIMRYVRTTMARYGDTRKPVTITELTWPSSLGRVRRPSDFDVSEREQARLLSAVYRRLAADRARLRLRSVHWADWLSDDRSRTDAFDYTGLSALRPSGSIRRKPAFFAYRSTARALRGAPR
jgi:hypothetical protein